MIDIDLSEVLRVKDFYHACDPSWVKRVWKKPQSMDWFLKRHRAQLISRGALIRLGRDYFLLPKVFEVCAKEILLKEPKNGA